MQNRFKHVVSALLLAFEILFIPNLLRADVTGSILGVVRDRSQATVAGARIVVLNAQTNFSQETASGADGSYRFLALPAGTYKLTATGTGFRAYTATDIEVKVNDQLRVDITLDVGSVTEQVQITANAVQVETQSTQLGDVIDSRKMLSLPLNGRSYLDLLGLQAGVVPITSGSIQQDRPVSGYIDSPGNLSVNGLILQNSTSMTSGSLNLFSEQHHQGGDGLHSEALRQLRRAVDVDLDQLDLPGLLPGQLLQRGADHPARPAPGRPQVHQDRDRGLLGNLGEVRISGVGDPR